MEVSVHRPQFSLKTLIWLLLVVAAFFGGIATEQRLEERRFQRAIKLIESEGDALFYPDQEKWEALTTIRRHREIKRLKTATSPMTRAR